MKHYHNPRYSYQTVIVKAERNGICVTVAVVIQADHVRQTVNGRTKAGRLLSADFTRKVINTTICHPIARFFYDYQEVHPDAQLNCL